MPSADFRSLLVGRRREERLQAQRYRILSAAAEETGDIALAERLHGLHADEQHHLSRLTARLLELGEEPEDLGSLRAEPPALDGWEIAARRWEREEMEHYRKLLLAEPDEDTARLLREILEVEAHHMEVLGGKWTGAVRG